MAAPRVSDGNISVGSVFAHSAITRCSTIGGDSSGSIVTANTNNLRMHNKQASYSSRSWWARRARWQRVVLGAIYTLVIFLLGVLAALLIYHQLTNYILPHYFKDNKNFQDWSQMSPSLSPANVNIDSVPASAAAAAEKYDTCTTRGCVAAATKIMNAVDPAVNPCDDFYQYACGKWTSSHVIPEDKGQYGTFEINAEQLDISIKRMLEDPKPTGIASTERAKNVYAACMNKPLIAKVGVEPAFEFLRKVHPWPVIQAELYDEASYDLVQSLANTARMGKSILFAAYVGSDSKNPTRRVLQIDQPSLGMPSRDYLLRTANDTAVQAYYQYMASVAAILDLRRPVSLDAPPRQPDDIVAARARIERELLDVLDFEIRLANLTVPKELRRDPNRMYNNMTLSQLADRVPGFKWLRFFHSLMLGSGVVIDSNEMVIVAEPEFLLKLMVLIQSTPKKVIANYVGWRTIQAHIHDLDESFKEPRLRLSQILFGISSDPPRWKSCIGNTVEAFDMGVGRLYIDNHFDKQSKVLAQELVNDVRTAFEQHLDELDWMLPEERQLSREKAAAMINQIGYSDQLQNNTWLDEYHVDNTGNATDHFGNMVKNIRANVKYWHKRLRQPVDRFEWDIQPANINAFYNPSANSIMFLAGILQAPYFSRDQPMSLNFGSIGVIMGHEITHGFDDEGRQFDKNGQLRDWWSKATVQKYLNKTQCVIDQYNNFTVDDIGLKLNGINTQGENIADMGGVQQAYRAYHNWMARQTPVVQRQQLQHLPGLQHITHEQLFFLSGATAWCAIERPERMKQLILTDSHSPEKYRILGPFSNMPEFSRAFNCPLGSAMNRVDKCRVW